MTGGKGRFVQGLWRAFKRRVICNPHGHTWNVHHFHFRYESRPWVTVSSVEICARCGLSKPFIPNSSSNHPGVLYTTDN